MKKLLVILLLVCMLGIVFTGIVSGSWKKWDESLPPWDSKYWSWIIHAPGRHIPVQVLSPTGNVIFLYAGLAFLDKRDSKKRVLVIVYSSGTADKEYEIPDPRFAIAAFPLEKEEVLIMAYKIENDKSKFFEKWKIPFKDNESVIPKDTDTQFKKIFSEFIVSQMERIHETDVGKFTDQLVPRLQILNKKNYLIKPF